MIQLGIKQKCTSSYLDSYPCERREVNLKKFMPLKIKLNFLPNWMEYDRGDSFPLDIEPNEIIFGSIWMEIYRDIFQVFLIFTTADIWKYIFLSLKKRGQFWYGERIRINRIFIEYFTGNAQCVLYFTGKSRVLFQDLFQDYNSKTSRKF